MGQAADHRSVSQRGGMGARHLRSRSRRPALFSKAGSRSNHWRGSPPRCSASRPAQLVTALPNATRSRPQRCDLFEHARCLRALSPPCRLKRLPKRTSQIKTDEFEAEIEADEREVFELLREQVGADLRLGPERPRVLEFINNATRSNCFVLTAAAVSGGSVTIVLRDPGVTPPC